MVTFMTFPVTRRSESVSLLKGNSTQNNHFLTAVMYTYLGDNGRFIDIRGIPPPVRTGHVTPFSLNPGRVVALVPVGLGEVVHETLAQLSLSGTMLPWVAEILFLRQGQICPLFRGVLYEASEIDVRILNQYTKVCFMIGKLTFLQLTHTKRRIRTEFNTRTYTTYSHV